jgi:hypothetical protein
MFQVSHKLVYIADKVINPVDDSQLLNLSRVKTATEGKGLFSFCSINLNDRKLAIKNIDASVSSNFSSSKGIEPNVQLFFLGSGSNSFDFLKKIPDLEFEESGLIINNETILNKNDLDNKEFISINKSLTPLNVIKFNSTLNNELVFIPQPSKNEDSILNEFQNIYTTSFTNRFEKNSRIEIPIETKYLLVFPVASMPVPIPRNPLNVKTGNIKVSIILNFEIEEI